MAIPQLFTDLQGVQTCLLSSLKMAFTCNQCPSTFTEATNLNRHIRTKHSNKSFKCERCEFSSARSDKLKKHIESKHYGNKVKCPHCAFEATRNDNLTRHIKSYLLIGKLFKLEAEPSTITNTFLYFLRRVVKPSQ